MLYFGNMFSLYSNKGYKEKFVFDIKANFDTAHRNFQEARDCNALDIDVCSLYVPIKSIRYKCFVLVLQHGARSVLTQDDCIRINHSQSHAKNTIVIY